MIAAYKAIDQLPWGAEATEAAAEAVTEAVTEAESGAVRCQSPHSNVSLAARNPNQAIRTIVARRTVTQ